MRFFFVFLVLLTGTAQADWIEAAQAYQKQDYVTAKAGFETLIPLGNEAAAFNLGVMAYHGQAQTADVVTAVAYFMLAEQLKHPDDSGTLERLKKTLNAEQLLQAEQQYQALEQSVVVKKQKARANKVLTKVQKPTLVKHREPKYPTKAAQYGVFGFVQLRFLVDEQGKVHVIDILDAYPENVFETASVNAVKSWRYEPTGEKFIWTVELRYSIANDIIDPAAVEKILQQNGLWDYAVAGYPLYQRVVGTLFNLLEIQSGSSLRINPELSSQMDKPDLTVFNKIARPKIPLEGFEGNAEIKISEDGIVVEELNVRFLESSTVATLVGLKLQGRIETDHYLVSRMKTKNNRTPYIWIQPVVEVPEIMTNIYWWDLAARSGDRQAQYILSVNNDDWERYLILQKEPAVMAWHGAELILEDDDYQQGIALLDEAIALGYKPANELKKLLKQ